jgi:hypothetical protein
MISKKDDDRMDRRCFPFTLYAVEGGAVVTMNCGDGVFRSRSMPTSMLECMVDACNAIRRDVIDRFRAEGHTPPPFPKCTEIGSGEIGSCVVRVTASRHDDKPEFAVGFYDEGDLSAPALVLIDEQLEEFIALGASALAELSTSDASAME